ncbi:unnamed protein product [marine sediment metagenome]|uniref:Single-stranded DNA-binding protein n=1 Tax=marine sediment metagenome TaxID=412755 RepID=X1D8F7_9ZZZZ
MNNLNSILLEGNLVKDPELKYTEKGTAVCNFTVASNRYFKQDDEKHEEVSYFDITVWSRLAEVCNEYLTKGRGVRVVGRLKQDHWEDSEGKTRYKVHIIAEHVEFKPRFKKDGDQPESEQEQEQAESAQEELAQASSF